MCIRDRIITEYGKIRNVTAGLKIVLDRLYKTYS